MTRKAADGIRSRVEALVACRIAGEPLSTDLAKWVRDLGDDLRRKLADQDLVEQRQSSTLGEAVDAFIASRADAAENTLRNWRNSRAKLVDYFGEDQDLRSISLANADDWRQSLVDAGLSDSTISKAVKHAKQFLTWGVRRRLCDENPFRELKAGGEENPLRKAFVDLETIERISSGAPTASGRRSLASLDSLAFECRANCWP